MIQEKRCGGDSYGRQICPQCGAVVEADATECRYCRTKLDGSTSTNQMPYQQNVFQNTANGNSDVESNKVFAILAYIGILVLVPIFAAPNSKFAKFHANQGLVLFIAEVILLAIAWTLGGLWIIRLLVNVARILCLVLAILGIVAAAQGEEKELPVIGSIHILK